MRAAALLLFALALSACSQAATTTENQPQPFTTIRLPGPQRPLIVTAPTLGTPRYDEARDAWVAPFGRGEATLTIEPSLQKAIVSDLRMGRPQWGAVVFMDVETGEILALAEHSERENARNGQLGVGAAVQPLAQAASIFKIVTASALVRARVPLHEEACGSGGKTRLRPSNLEEDGWRCVRFEDALPLSQNVAMAKLASKHISPAKLRDEATLFGFNQPLALELPVQASIAEIPDDEFEFATTAAGFGETRLTALHGALLAAIVGNDGVMVPPRIIKSVTGELDPAPRAPVRVLDEQHASVLQAMMRATVSRGTASRAMSASYGVYGHMRPVPVEVAGKTGSLTDRANDVDTTWFVGTAPAHAPKIAFAIVVINDEWIWHVRALDVTRRALAAYFARHPEDTRTSPPVASTK